MSSPFKPKADDAPHLSQTYPNRRFKLHLVKAVASLDRVGLALEENRPGRRATFVQPRRNNREIRE